MSEQEEIGELAILNVGTGDTKLTFNSDDPDEVLKASTVVKDMLRRGYAILVQVGEDDKGPLYRRAYDFDQSTNEYIIAGAPPPDDPGASLVGHPDEPETAPPRHNIGRSKRRGPAKRTTERVSAKKHKAVAVPRTAGG